MANHTHDDSGEPHDIDRAALEAADREVQADRALFERGYYPGLCRGLNDGTGCPHTPQHSYDHVRH